MAKLLTIAVICSFLFVSFQALSIQEKNVSVVTVDNWNDSLRAHPEFEAITPLNGNLTAFAYKFGKRETGDRLVGNVTIDKKWNAPQDTIFATMYPGSGGVGAVVTHVQVDVKQDSPSSNSTIFGGGIGQRTITIGVRAFQVTFIEFTIKVFGRD